MSISGAYPKAASFTPSSSFSGGYPKTTTFIPSSSVSGGYPKTAGFIPSSSFSGGYYGAATFLLAPAECFGMAVIGDLLLRIQGNFDDVMGTTVFDYVVGIAKRDVVKFVSADTVGKADATLSPSEPAIGVVLAVDEPQSGKCIVRSLGCVGGFSGLTIGKRYILSRASGEIVEGTDSGNPDYPQPGDFKQTIGVAISTTQLMVGVDPTTFEI